MSQYIPEKIQGILATHKQKLTDTKGLDGVLGTVADLISDAPSVLILDLDGTWHDFTTKNGDKEEKKSVRFEIDDGRKSELIKPIMTLCTETLDSLIKVHITKYVNELNAFNFAETDPDRVDIGTLEELIAYLKGSLDTYKGRLDPLLYTEKNFARLGGLLIASYKTQLQPATDLLTRAEEFHNKMLQEQERKAEEQKRKVAEQERKALVQKLKEKEAKRNTYLSGRDKRVGDYVEQLEKKEKKFLDHETGQFGTSVSEAMKLVNTDADRQLLAEMLTYAEFTPNDLNPYLLFRLISDYNYFFCYDTSGPRANDLDSSTSLLYPNYLYPDDSTDLRDIFCWCRNPYNLKRLPHEWTIYKERLERLKGSPNDLIKQIATRFEENVFKNIEWT